MPRPRKDAAFEKKRKPLEQYYTIQEVAEAFRLTPAHVSNLCERAELNAVDFASSVSKQRCLRIPLSEIERYLEENSLSK